MFLSKWPDIVPGQTKGLDHHQKKQNEMAFAAQYDTAAGQVTVEK